MIGLSVNIKRIYFLIIIVKFLNLINCLQEIYLPQNVFILIMRLNLFKHEFSFIAGHPVYVRYLHVAVLF